jgi:hypothetical protein
MPRRSAGDSRLNRCNRPRSLRSLAPRSEKLDDPRQAQSFERACTPMHDDDHVILVTGAPPETIRAGRI